MEIHLFYIQPYFKDCYYDMLCVDGKIVSSEIVILCNKSNPTEGLSLDEHWTTNDNQWPDFVFSDTFSSIALNLLESRIKEEKHLPGIPSAKEVANNGINLGEF
jgi:hypothetical protein